MSAPIGVRMAQPSRPVVAVVGDGSAMYTIQALWSAVRYEVGAIFVVLANGGYRVMDRLAEAQHEAAVAQVAAARAQATSAGEAARMSAVAPTVARARPRMKSAW